MLYHSWDRKKVSFFFFTLKIAGKCIFSKQGTYSIVNKSAKSPPCCHSYHNLLHLFTQISKIEISKKMFLKTQISDEKQKNQMPVDRTCFTSIWEWPSYLDWKITLYLTSALTTTKKSEFKNRKKNHLQISYWHKIETFFAKIIW